MSANIPTGRLQSLAWLEANITVWSTNQAIIGLTSAQIASLAIDIANTRQSFTSVEEVRAESKAKTQDFYSKSEALSLKAASYITIIKGTALSSTTPAAVYLAANITPKDPPSPVAPPLQPVITDLTLNSLGEVMLKWSGRGPTGTNYIVSRKLDAGTAWTIVGQAGSLDKSFLDATIPTGTTAASYNVRAVRGSDESLPSTQATITLGGLASGATSGVAA